jgi:hypothetical protein
MGNSRLGRRTKESLVSGKLEVLGDLNEVKVEV